MTTGKNKNEKRGMMVSGAVHVVLAALCLLPFMSLMDIEEPEKKQIAITFTPPPVKKPVVKPKPKPLKAKKTKAKASQAPPKTIPKPAKTVPTPKAKPVPKPVAKPVAKPKPNPKPTPRPKPVVTQPKPTTPPAPKPSPKPAPSSKPAPPVNIPSVPVPDGSATNTGSPKNPSSGTSGEGKTPSDNDSGKADIDEKGEDLFSRKVIYRQDITNLIKESGKIMVDLCVNQAGKVVSATYNKGGSTLHDRKLTKLAEDATKHYKFEKDGSAPKSHCGKLTFVFKIDA